MCTYAYFSCFFALYFCLPIAVSVSVYLSVCALLPLNNYVFYLSPSLSFPLSSYLMLSSSISRSFPSLPLFLCPLPLTPSLSTTCSEPVSLPLSHSLFSALTTVYPYSQLELVTRSMSNLEPEHVIQQSQRHPGDFPRVEVTVPNRKS